MSWTATITRVEDGLRIGHPGKGTHRLLPLSAEAFLVEDVELPVRFELDENGRPTGMTLTHGPDRKWTGRAAAFDFEWASRNVPKPREIWPIVKKHTVPPEFRILSDEVVAGDTDPGTRLRKVTAHFWSQELAGRKWGHQCVIFLPEDPFRNLTAERKGKVVMIGSPGRVA